MDISFPSFGAQIFVVVSFDWIVIVASGLLGVLPASFLGVCGLLYTFDFFGVYWYLYQIEWVQLLSFIGHFGFLYVNSYNVTPCGL